MKRLPNYSTTNIKRFNNLSDFHGHYVGGLYDLHCGAGCNVFGYAHESFKKALINNYHKVTNSYWKIKNSVWTEFEENLEFISDSRYSHYITSLTGSDGVDNALKIMWYASNTNHKTILVRSNSFHSGSIAGWQMVKDSSITKDWAKIKFVNFFSDLEQKVVEIGPENVAGVLIDTVSWVNGLSQNDLDYWKKFQQTIDKYDLTFCVDEILTGMGRMGHWIHSHSLGLKPDIIVLGKAVAAGHENLNVTLVNRKIINRLGEKWIAIGNTRNNNTQGALIANTVINYMKKNNTLAYINEKIIPHCKKIKSVLTSKGWKTSHAGTLVFSFPPNLIDLESYLCKNGYYHNWDKLWYSSFYDIKKHEMDAITELFESYNELDSLQKF